LGRYELLSEAARERERGYRAGAEHLRMRIAELDRFLAGLPALNEQLATAQTELDRIRTERTGMEARAAELERRAQMLVGLRDSLARLTERLTGIEREEDQARRQREDAETRSRAAEELLAGEDAIRLRVAELLAARQENDRLGQLVLRLRDLEARSADAKQVIASEEARIKSELRAAGAGLAQARAVAAALAALMPELELARTRHGRAVDLQQDRGRIAADLEVAVGRIGEVRGTMSSLNARCDELREKIVTLRRAGAVCPTCGGELDDMRRKEAVEAAMREGVQSREQISALEARERELLAEQERLQITLGATDKGIREAQQAGRRQAELEEKARAMRVQADLIPTIEESAGGLAQALQTMAFAQDARSAMETVTREATALGYSQDAHHAILTRIRTLTPAEAQLQKLDAARGDLQAAAIDLSAAQARIDALAAERTRILAEIAPLQEAVLELPAARAALQDARSTLGTMRETEESLQQRVGGLRNQVEESSRRAEERSTALDALAEADKNVWAHRELATIFGKRGIQTMLIENALPELEQDANEMLARMTDNSTQVKFATQRQGTGGKAIETLEIQIADSMGTRNYEMFSGGEAFRINFAIRIALSKLLTRRAGADLSFLLIDEGFGTQDDMGRDRLVEAIGAVAEDFEKILVVTHIDELKDQFDVHVEISKGLAGSQIAVSAA